MDYQFQYKQMLLEGMVERRMANTGETRIQAWMAVKKYICQNLLDKGDNSWFLFILNLWTIQIVMPN